MRVYGRILNSDEIAAMALGEPLNAIARKPGSDAHAAGTAAAALVLSGEAAETEVRDAWKQLTVTHPRDEKSSSARSHRDGDGGEPNAEETHLLLRGAYDKPGEKVEPGVPAVLPPLPDGAPNNRLGFAKWLIDPANPLLARVTVNRFWQMYFGAGIVKTDRRFRCAGGVAIASGTARLARHGVRPNRLGCESACRS